MRSAQSRPIIERIGKALAIMKKSRRHLPKSALGQAIDYTLTLWPMLQVYLEDGRVEIDNNGVENAIRPTAVGKKNWLFIGEAEAGQRSAIFYTVIEACRRRGIDPFEYLRDAFARIPSMAACDYAQLLPETWSKGRDTKIPTGGKAIGRAKASQAGAKRCA